MKINILVFYFSFFTLAFSQRGVTGDKTFSSRFPEDKFNAFNKKKILKDVAKLYVPEKIINQRKRGFNAPVSYWINSEIIYQLKID